MKLFFRILRELVLLIIIFLGGFFLNNYLQLGFNEFLIRTFVFYLIIRMIISLISKTISYRKTNRFKDYNDTLSKLAFERNVYGTVTIIFFLISSFGGVFSAFAGLVVIFGLLWILSFLAILSNEKKKVKQENKLAIEQEEYLSLYGEMPSEPYNLFMAPFYSEYGYELLSILTDNTFGILNDYGKEDPLILLDKLSRSNYLFYIQRSMYFGDVHLLCGLINAYLERIDLKIRIKPNDILVKDSEQMKKRREDYQDTLYHDLKIIDQLLKKKKYHLVNIGLLEERDCFLNLAIVTDNVYEKLVKFRSNFDNQQGME